MKARPHERIALSDVLESEGVFRHLHQVSEGKAREGPPGRETVRRRGVDLRRAQEEGQGEAVMAR